MLGILSIYVLGLLICLVAGTAVCGLLEPDGRWLGAQTLPIGLAALMAVIYPLGAVLPGARVAPVALVMVTLATGVAVWLRRKRRGSGGTAATLRRAPAPGVNGLIALGGAVLAGLLILVPTMRQGFPTTIGATNNDGWGYAVLVEWMKDHSMFGSITPSVAEPLTLAPSATLDLHFGIGFEHFATLLATVLGRDGFEVVNAAAAVALAAAVGGWAMLAAELDAGLGRLESAMVVLAVASPVVVLPFAENYTTQFVGICLWPAALATFLRFSRRPTAGRLVMAGLGTGAVVGVYPALVPWLVLPVVVVAALAPRPSEWGSTRLARLAGPGHRAQALRALALPACLAAAVVVLSPIQVERAVRNLLQLDSLMVGAVTTFFSLDAYAAFAVGATSAFSLLGATPLSWPMITGLIVAVAAYAVALLPWERPGPARALFLAVGASVLLTTAVVFVRYRVLDELSYQVYKGLISGGAVLSGLVVVGLVVGGSARSRALRLVVAAVLLATWVPVTAQVLQTSADGPTGFRAADVQMGRALRALPTGSVVLAEGAAPDARSFQFRMMAGYFGTRRSGITTIGLGSTASYLALGGGPEWRPDRPWEYVLTTGPQPVASDRGRVWGNAYYSLAAAPSLDLTTYGAGWYPPEMDGSRVFAWTSAASELVLSNRAPTSQEVSLEMAVASHTRTRTLSVTTAGGVVRRRLAADAITPVRVDLTLPARSATPVRLDARPAATIAAGGDGRALLIRVQGLRILPRATR